VWAGFAASVEVEAREPIDQPVHPRIEYYTQILGAALKRRVSL
jgi:hypothetical protein